MRSVPLCRAIASRTADVAVSSQVIRPADLPPAGVIVMSLRCHGARCRCSAYSVCKQCLYVRQLLVSVEFMLAGDAGNTATGSTICVNGLETVYTAADLTVDLERVGFRNHPWISIGFMSLGVRCPGEIAAWASSTSHRTQERACSPPW